MRQVIAMHGWGGDSNTWKIWASQFQKDKWLWQSVERGYGEITPFSPNWKNATTYERHQQRVVIAHSLGPHLLTKEVLKQSTKIVFLCSFSRFIPNEVTSRSLKTALKGMQKHLGTINEVNMLKSFLEKACHPEAIDGIPPGPITKGLSVKGRKKLKSDLQLLIQTNGLPQGIPVEAKVLIVQGKEDSIIVPESRSCLIEDLTDYLEHSPTYWEIPNAGHLLLMPGLIKRVQSWLNSDL